MKLSEVPGNIRAFSVKPYYSWPKIDYLVVYLQTIEINLIVRL
jgi:hypothetical protein